VNYNRTIKSQSSYEEQKQSEIYIRCTYIFELNKCLPPRTFHCGNTMIHENTIRYIPVLLNTLKIDSIKSFGIFIKLNNGNMVLYDNKSSTHFNAGFKDRLIYNKMSYVYILGSDKQLYDAYLEENLTSLLNNPEIRIEQKSELVYHSITTIAKTHFDTPRVSSNKHYKTTILKLLPMLSKKKVLLKILLKLHRMVSIL
jgi:hypothetical protein